jgi:glycine/D-amino acid oxidase-like deaminating enzyme
MDGDMETDVAIVGGGFTGLSSALHLADTGRDCVELEAEAIGYGGSGRNVVLVNPGVWLPPQDVQTILGEERGGAFVQTMGEMPAYVFSLIEKHQIRCEVTRSGTIHAAHSPAGFEDLSRRHEEWRRLGSSVDLLSPEQTAEATGSKAFHGGLLDHRAGTINPIGYVRGLARAAVGAGASIRTGAKVTALTEVDGKWRLTTDAGSVTASTVVLGTNAYKDELWPGLADVFTQIHYFQVVTEPLGDRTGAILPGLQGLWDTAQVMFSIRKDAFGRLLIGSMGKVIGGDRGLTRYWAGKTLRRLFPQLGDVGWEDAWHGQIAMTPDHLPRLLNLAPGIYAPIGYNGRGITTGTMFGRAIADHLAGASESSMPVPITQPKPTSNRAIKARLFEVGFKAYRLYQSIK